MHEEVHRRWVNRTGTSHSELCSCKFYMKDKAWRLDVKRTLLVGVRCWNLREQRYFFLVYGAEISAIKIKSVKIISFFNDVASSPAPISNEVCPFFA